MTVRDFVTRLVADDWIMIRGPRGRAQLAQVLPTSDLVRANGGLKVWKFIEEPGQPSHFSAACRIPRFDVLRRPTHVWELEAVRRAERFQERELDQALRESDARRAQQEQPNGAVQAVLTLFFVAIGRAGMAVLS